MANLGPLRWWQIFRLALVLSFAGLSTACDSVETRMAGDARIADTGLGSLGGRYFLTLPEVPLGPKRVTYFTIQDIPPAVDYALELEAVVPVGHLENNEKWSQFCQTLQNDQVVAKVHLTSLDGATIFFKAEAPLLPGWNPSYRGNSTSVFYPNNADLISLKGDVRVEIAFSDAPSFLEEDYSFRLKLKGGGLQK